MSTQQRLVFNECDLSAGLDVVNCQLMAGHQLITSVQQLIEIRKNICIKWVTVVGWTSKQNENKRKKNNNNNMSEEIMWPAKLIDTWYRKHFGFHFDRMVMMFVTLWEISDSRIEHYILLWTFLIFVCNIFNNNDVSIFVCEN